jgi:poly(3-hydroxybutyrate) depolymerase
MGLTMRRYLLTVTVILGLGLWGCDQDSGTPIDTSTDDVIAGDSVDDTVVGDTLEDTPAGDSVTDVPADTGEDTTFVLPEPGTYSESVAVDGITRTYVIHVPATAVASMATGRVPFLIALHGAGDTGSNFISATRLTDLAAANAFVVVGPDGYNRGWFIQASEGWPGTDGNTTSINNDIDYMQTLIEIGYDTYGIDRNRIYACGHSRGAGMTGLLASQSNRVTTSMGLYTSPFAAYVVNAGYDAYGGSFDLTLSTPRRPVWIIHGTSDGVVPFSMGEEFATDLEAAGWDVTFTSVSAGHTWLFQSSTGYSNQDMWDFFAANPLP